MKFITLPKARSRLLLLSFAAFFGLALSTASAGCGQTMACFEWSQSKGECPAADKAKPFFSAPPACAGNIASIDSPPHFENDLCCYAVTKLDSAPCTDPPPRTACFRCSEAATTPNLDLNRVCPESLATFTNLQSCACSTTCASSCMGDFCAGGLMGDTCNACIVDPTGCADAWNLCMAN